MTVEEVVAEVAGYRCPWVCFTGGEPTLYDLQPLCDQLKARGHLLQVETNGQHPRPAWGLDHITVSPKENEGGFLHTWYLENATEFKYVVDDESDLARAAANPSDKTIYLQPNALVPSATALCIAAVQENPTRFRLSLQTHKYLQIR
jgi:7-carboxy-7-deazaguanine synthase